MSTGYAVLDLMVKHKDSRKFSFNELKRHLGYPMGSLDNHINQELKTLLEMGTIGKIPHDYFGYLYYVSFSKQDPSRKMSIRITCAEGRTQSLRSLDNAEDAPDIFRRYKQRLQAVQDRNPGITDKWIAGLTYNVE